MDYIIYAKYITVKFKNLTKAIKFTSCIISGPISKYILRYIVLNIKVSDIAEPYLTNKNRKVYLYSSKGNRLTI